MAGLMAMPVIRTVKAVRLAGQPVLTKRLVSLPSMTLETLGNQWKG
jgi:hypothetical protein